MVRINRILVATDFSECSGHALRYACEFAEVFSAELHLLHVVAPPTIAYSEFAVDDIGTTEAASEWISVAQEQLESHPSERWQKSLSIKRKVVIGTPFVETVRYAREHNIDLIVVGTHGRGAIAHMLLGSTAEKVVRKASCPVLTVRPDGHEFVMP